MVFAFFGGVKLAGRSFPGWAPRRAERGSAGSGPRSGPRPSRRAWRPGVGEQSGGLVRNLQFLEYAPGSATVRARFGQGMPSEDAGRKGSRRFQSGAWPLRRDGAGGPRSAGGRPGTGHCKGGRSSGWRPPDPTAVGRQPAVTTQRKQASPSEISALFPATRSHHFAHLGRA